jgi:hypothetical protein
VKRFTYSELMAEWTRSAAVTGIHGPHIEGARTQTLLRFALRPHASAPDYE